MWVDQWVFYVDYKKNELEHDKYQPHNNNFFNNKILDMILIKPENCKYHDCEHS